MSQLNHIAVSTSFLTGDIYLYRYATDNQMALEKIPAEPMVMGAVVNHMMFNAPTEQDTKFL
jgi:hypothetical protein